MVYESLVGSTNIQRRIMWRAKAELLQLFARINDKIPIRMPYEGADAIMHINRNRHLMCWLLL